MCPRGHSFAGLARHVAVALALLVATAPGASRLAAAEPVFPPGGAIGLSTVPPDLRPARAYTGFEDPTRGVSILFAEMPAAVPWADFATRLTREALAAQGVAETARRAFPVAGREGVLVEGVQRTPGGGEVSKWAAFFDGGGFVGVVNAAVAGHPPPAEARATVEAALAALAVRAPDRAARRAALPFAFEETPRLRFVEALAGSGAVLAPEGTGIRDSAPWAVIASAVGPVFVAEPRWAEVAERQLRSTRGMAGLAFEPGVAATLAGLPAVETRARGTDADGRAVRVAQWAVFPPEGGMLRVIAQAPAEEFDAALPEFRALAASVRRR